MATIDASVKSSVSVLRLWSAHSLVALLVGAAACSSPPNLDKSKMNGSGAHNYELIIASDSPRDGFAPATVESTGERIYLSNEPSDRISEFDSVVPSIVATGLHVSAWLPDDALNRLSDLTQKHVGKRLAFQASGAVLSAAEILQPIQFTGRVNIGVTTQQSDAQRLLNLFSQKK